MLLVGDIPKPLFEHRISFCGYVVIVPLWSTALLNIHRMQPLLIYS